MIGFGAFGHGFVGIKPVREALVPSPCHGHPWGNLDVVLRLGVHVDFRRADSLGGSPHGMVAGRVRRADRHRGVLDRDRHPAYAYQHDPVLALFWQALCFSASLGTRRVAGVV
jgi:hypothetical protein